MLLYHEDIATIDLESGNIYRSFLSHTIGEGDVSANRFGVHIQRNGEDKDLSGSTCTGYFIRSTGDTVVISGTVSGSDAYVQLPEACYAYEGQFSLAIKLTGGGVTGTMRIVDGVVSNTTTGTIVDPGTLIPSIEDLIDAINDAVASIPADYSALNNSLEMAGRKFETVIPASMYTVKGILNEAGTGVSEVGNYYTTEYIPIFDQDIFFIGNFFPNTGYNTLVLYDEEYNVLLRVHGEAYVKAWEYSDAKYFRASEDITDPDNPLYYTIIGNRKSYEYMVQILSFFNSPTPEKLPASVYYFTGILSGDGSVIRPEITGYYTTDYIEIVGTHLFFSGGFFPAPGFTTFCLYDASKQPLVTGLGNTVIALGDYPTAKYFRASKALDDTYYVAASKLNPNVIEKREIHIGSGKPYTTLRAGIAEAITVPGSIVYVHPGTYDLTQEFATEIANHSGSGITLANGVHVIFLPGAYVTALFSTYDEWVSTYFEPFYGYDFTLEGLNIKASNCRYCVHDERSGADLTYHNVYKNCIMEMAASVNFGQCIGGGLGKNGYIEIEGGKYKSTHGSGGTDAISYHNGNIANAYSTIVIRDVYLADGNNFRFGYYGPSTLKSPVMICGCSMGAAIVVAPETAGSTEENFALTEWNNIIRS